MEGNHRRNTAHHHFEYGFFMKGTNSGVKLTLRLKGMGSWIWVCSTRAGADFHHCLCIDYM